MPLAAFVQTASVRPAPCLAPSLTRCRQSRLIIKVNKQVAGAVSELGLTMAVTVSMFVLFGLRVKSALYLQ